MIQEPARIQATTYEAQENHTETFAGEKTYSSNCNCSRMRIEQTEPTKDSPHLTSTTTTIPIVINTQPNPRIFLIKVPKHSSSNNPRNSNINSNNNRTEPTTPRTRLIRIPFLPGSVPTPSSVKQAQPTTSSSVKYTTPVTASRRIVTKTPSGTGIIYPPEKCSSSSYSQLNQVASDRILGPPTSLETLVTQTVQVTKEPQTLATMAGIQLTGVDMESHQDMSGAMPTATVEEIDVPVFIDEYLQNIEATSSTSNSNSTTSEENGKENSTETDIFDFDFDINLIAEDLIERKEMDQCSPNMDITYSDNINNDLTMDEELGDIGEEALDVSIMCGGIDFNSQQDDDLTQYMVRSEDPLLGNASQGSVLSASQTKYFFEQPRLGNENSMDANYNYYGASQASLGFSQLDVNNDEVSGLICHDVSSSSSCVGVKLSAAAPIAESTMPHKRNIKIDINLSNSLNNSQPAIDTPEIIEQVLNLVEQNTSSNISTQDSIFETLLTTEDNTTFTGYQDFSAPNTPNSAYSVSTSISNYNSNAPSCQTGYGGLITAPGSPALSTASTSQFSTTTRNGGGGNKRKRGRPAKEHADGPDPEVMSRLSGEELKLYQDRIRNNEASRVSRRKTKNREEAEKIEEDELLRTFNTLSANLQNVLADKKLLKNYLMQQHHRNSTYVKPEPEH